jgi:hypothetical protein
MSTTEWVLVALVILIPALVAAGVTLWTLEQALKRQKKHRRKQETIDQPKPDLQSPDPTA